MIYFCSFIKIAFKTINDKILRKVERFGVIMDLIELITYPQTILILACIFSISSLCRGL